MRTDPVFVALTLTFFLIFKAELSEFIKKPANPSSFDILTSFASAAVLCVS